MRSQFHGKSFDDATKAKLDIYRRYLLAWLPTFVSRPPPPTWDRINIFDFFCGPGCDATGQDGSPLIALRTAQQYLDLIRKNGHQLTFWFNDVKKKNITKLREIVAGLDLPKELRIEYRAQPFKVALFEALPHTYRAANLIFADQFGIKEMNRRVFSSLQGIKGTDMIFFMSSSYCRRFIDTPEISRYLTKTLFEGRSYADSHRAICDYYKSLIPPGYQYHLTPFSLKKGSNIHGLIFGTSHYLGLEKFLKVCWEIDPERGEANWDIDNDQLPGQNDTLDLFKKQSKKIDIFQDQLERSLTNGEAETDAAVYRFTLESGFLPLHARPVLQQMIKKKTLQCIDGRPRLSKEALKAPRQFMRLP